jgi:hypothetical protein
MALENASVFRGFAVSGPRGGGFHATSWRLRMSALSFDDRTLGWCLGLGDLGDARTPCMTYACACVCAACQAREAGPVEAPLQPWELAA